MPLHYLFYFIYLKFVISDRDVTPTYTIFP